MIHQQVFNVFVCINYFNHKHIINQTKREIMSQTYGRKNEKMALFVINVSAQQNA